MKLHPDTPSGQNTVTAYGPGYVTINGRRYEHSMIVMPDRLELDWPVTTLESLQTEHLLSLQCDVVLLGTGAKQRFPAASILRAMFEARVGIEVMDTPAACRTYNILMAEGRNVAAALIIE